MKIIRDELQEQIRQLLSDELGEVTEKNGVLRAFAEGLGMFGRSAIVELSFLEFADDAPNAWPILQFYSTLAAEIEDKDVPGIKRRLTDLNEQTMLGCYGYYAPLCQIYHCYRLPLDPHCPESALKLIGYSLKQILRQLHAFLDYVLTIADDPESVSAEEYVQVTHAGDILGECMGVLRDVLESMEPASAQDSE